MQRCDGSWHSIFLKYDVLDHDILLSLIAWMLCKIFGNFHQLTSLHHITYGNSCFQLSTLLLTCFIQFIVPKLDFYVPLDYTVSKTHLHLHHQYLVPITFPLVRTFSCPFLISLFPLQSLSIILSGKIILLRKPSVFYTVTSFSVQSFYD